MTHDFTWFHMMVCFFGVALFVEATVLPFVSKPQTKQPKAENFTSHPRQRLRWARLAMEGGEVNTAYPPSSPGLGLCLPGPVLLSKQWSGAATHGLERLFKVVCFFWGGESLKWFSSCTKNDDFRAWRNHFWSLHRSVLPRPVKQSSSGCESKICGEASISGWCNVAGSFLGKQLNFLFSSWIRIAVRRKVREHVQYGFNPVMNWQESPSEDTINIKIAEYGIQMHTISTPLNIIYIYIQIYTVYIYIYLFFYGLYIYILVCLTKGCFNAPGQDAVFAPPTATAWCFLERGACCVVFVSYQVWVSFRRIPWWCNMCVSYWWCLHLCWFVFICKILIVTSDFRKQHWHVLQWIVETLVGRLHLAFCARGGRAFLVDSTDWSRGS